MNLTKAAITRPVFILMLMLGAVLLGTISYRSMRVELNPEVSFGVITINTPYPGAGPEEIANLVSRPVEESVSGVNGIREITSTSQEGFSVVVVQLELGVNTDIALADIRAKVDSISNSLPQDALKPSINKLDTTSEPILTLSFRSDRMNSQQLRDLVDNRIRDRFQQIPGVASANLIGGDEREIQVQVQKDKLLANGIGIADLQRQIAGATINGPAGRLVEGDSEFAVRVPAEFKTVEDVRNMVLRISDPNRQGEGQIIRLRDVATVLDSVKERTTYSRLDGLDSLSLIIQKSREGNAIEITKAADKLIKQLETTDFKDVGLKVIKVAETADDIQNSLNDLNFDLAFAIFLVSAIVFIFLHDLRGTIIVAIAIPICIFATFIALKVFGFTINNITMLALTLAIGVLVDDAIVVLENIYRHLKMGEDPREAALNGRGEIGLAALAITFADVVVFLPIAFMGGITGAFLRPLAIAFSAAVLFSLFVSFTVTPMLASRWYKAGEDVENPKGRFAQWFERRFAALEHSYRRTLEWALQHRWFVFLLGNLALFAIIVFIAGSFQKSIAGAIQAGMPFVFIALILGLFVFAFNFLRLRRKPLAGLGIVAVSIAIGAVLGGIAKGALAQVPVPAAMLGIVFSIVILGVLSLFLNAAKPVVKSRMVTNAVLFGLLFPVAAVIGFGYGQWKGDAAFKFGFFPDQDSTTVSASIQLPPGTSLAATQRVVEYVEQKMSQYPDDVQFVSTIVGAEGASAFGGAGSSGSNYAQVQAVLYPKASVKDRLLGKTKKEKLRLRRGTAVAADMTEAIGRYPGAEIRVSAASGNGFGPPIQMSFASDDRQLLLQTVSKIRARLADGAVPGVINPDTTSKPGKPELQIVPDRLSLGDSGLSVAEVANAARVLYQGDNNTKFRVGGEEFDIRVMMDLRDRNLRETLNEVPLSFSQGNPILLPTVATIRQSQAPDKIERRNREEEVRITADLLPGFSAGSVQAQIDAMIAREKLIPAGIRTTPLGQADAQARESGFLFGALGLGLVLVYMLLASLYDNLLYPFIIQLAQPQAMVGAILALVLTDKALTIVGFIGIITLVGLVGKNAILLVDYTNTLRSRGRDRHDALVEAGPTRLRPILMTTLALVLGTLPIALSIGRGSEFRETIGITIIGGILLSTVLTLVVIPCSYTIFDDLSNTVGGWFRRKDGDGTATSGDPEPQPSAAPTPAV